MFNIVVSLGILLLSISFAFCGTVRRAESIVLYRELPDEEEEAEIPDEDTDEAETEDTDDNSGPEAVDPVPVGASTVGDAPETDAPVGDAPETDAPVGDAPETEAPVGDAPLGDAPEKDEIPKPELDYLKAQLAFYRGEKEVCEAKMRNPTITLDNYELLKKHWDGLTAMITGLEEVVA